MISASVLSSFKSFLYLFSTSYGKSSYKKQNLIHRPNMLLSLPSETQYLVFSNSSSSLIFLRGSHSSLTKQQFLYFLPLPQGHGSFLPIFFLVFISITLSPPNSDGLSMMDPNFDFLFLSKISSDV